MGKIPLSFDNSEMRAYSNDAAGVLDTAISSLSFVTYSIGCLSKDGIDLENISEGLCDILMDIEMKLTAVRERIIPQKGGVDG